MVSHQKSPQIKKMITQKDFEALKNLISLDPFDSNSEVYQPTAKDIALLIEGRAKYEFNKPLSIDKDNESVFKLLCYYFSNDPTFIDLATELKINNPALNKGLMLAGNVGTGKTYLMHLFSLNPLKCYDLVNAREIADEYERKGVDGINHLFGLRYTRIMGGYLNQNWIGLCIDDLGTESEKCHMGNKLNTVASIIERRYANGSMGSALHATSNLTVAQMNEFYGPRITSRFRETTNLIELPGLDRRGTIQFRETGALVNFTDKVPRKEKNQNDYI